MSEFKVTIEEIDTVSNHPNADRLEIATLTRLGFQFVVPIGVYVPGNRVIYFPVDSIIPQSHLEKMGLVGKLSGKDHDRLKTVKLRGVYSQGLVATPGTLGISADLEVGTDLTEMLGVTKYEPEPQVIKGANLLPLPNMVSKYDIESAQRFPTIAQTLEHVCITEKVEGSNWGTVFTLNDEGAFDVQTIQRNYTIEPVEGYEHTWVKLTKELLEKMSAAVLYLYSNGLERAEVINIVTFRGEILGPGIQGNYYKLPKHQVMLFDIEVNGQPLDFPEFLGVCQKASLPVVPIIASSVVLEDWLDGQSLVDASNGRSLLLPDKLREGIVIRPIWETTDVNIGRVILKVRSPQYLEKTGN